jgi:hypothetical protein
MLRRNARILLVVTLGILGPVAVPNVGLAQDHGRTRGVSRCTDERPQVRRTAYGTNRPVTRQRAYNDYVEREERSKTKTALMIGGAAATGAGVGGVLNGTKGALIGAAVGGGAASIYEATKRR